MGKKNKKVVDLGNPTDTNLAQEADQGRGYVSHKQAVAQEALLADKGQNMVDSDEEIITKKKKNKRNKGAQELDDFDQAVETPNQPAGELNELDEDRNLAQEMEENFGGMSKKNTRKKKNTGQNMQDDLIADAFDEGADSDEIQGKKGKNNKKRNRGKKNQDQEAEAETPVQEEETKGEVKVNLIQEDNSESSLAMRVVYCGSKCYRFYF